MSQGREDHEGFETVKGCRMSAQSMSPLLRILHLEDNPTDAELVRGMLEAAGVDCAIRRVETREAFQSALEREQFDLVISDFTLPSFDGLSALTKIGCPG